MAAILMRTDRNGTKYYVDHTCPKCGGNGYLHGYEHVSGGVCFLCGGSGEHTHGWKEYTPEYADKLAERRLARALAKAPQANAKYFERNGFAADGRTWVVMGDTFEIRESLKAAGAKYMHGIGWHFDHACDAYTVAEVSIEDIGHQTESGTWYVDTEKAQAVGDQLRKADAPQTNWVGAVGDKVTVIAKYDHRAWYEAPSFSGYGTQTMYVHTFRDANGNALVWKTSNSLYEIEAGTMVKVSGKVKAHDEYRGEKQTALTRCKVEKEEQA